MVGKYEQFDDHDIFEPIKIACGVDKNALKKPNKLTEKSPRL